MSEKPPITTGNLITILAVSIMMGSVGVVAWTLGGNAKPDTTQTISTTISTTQTTTQIIVSASVFTLTNTVSRTTTSISTLTNTVSFTTKLNSTTTTTTTTTRTLGTGASISDYRLFMTNVPPDSVVKLNLTISLVMNQPTYLTEVANVILTPSNGNANDIKFVPNPVITQTSDYTTVLSFYAILDHQIVAGTYIIEYAVSTSQGSALAYTVLEVTR